MSRVLFLHMPLAVPPLPNLAVHLLAGILSREGIGSDVLYGTTRLKRTPTVLSYIHSLAGEVIFAPLCFESHSKEELALKATRCQFSQVELQANNNSFAPDSETTERDEDCRWPITRRQITDTWPFGTEHDQLLADILTHMDLAEICINQCLTDIAVDTYDIFAFSVGFDAQKVASLALARRLKEREPSTKVVFGGTACDGDMGDELMKSFPFIDVISQGDADLTIVPLVLALRQQKKLSSVPGLIYRDGDEIRSTPPVAPLQNLDSLPIPNYDEFITQLEASDWQSEKPFILYEASRGCWWGEKHHCKFCGLRADGLAFRRKSPERTLEEIRVLGNNYPTHRMLYATDAILDYRFLNNFFPQLLEFNKVRKFKLFYEVKSNLKKRELALLAESGVISLQPGIESFSDHILKLMDKGSNCLMQIQLLKWMAAYKLNVVYNLIMGTPGETTEDYEEMLELIPSLTHLQPPSGAHFLSLDKFSPYFREPERYGIWDIRPEAGYFNIYPEGTIDLARLTYKMSYRSREFDDLALNEVWGRLRIAVSNWREEQKHRRLLWVKKPQGLELIEHYKDKQDVYPLSGLSAELYDFCDSSKSFAEICRTFRSVSERSLRACLSLWVKRQWMYKTSSDCYLSLAVEVNPPGFELFERVKQVLLNVA